jgi:hypothetical protein
MEEQQVMYIEVGEILTKPNLDQKWPFQCEVIYLYNKTISKELKKLLH